MGISLRRAAVLAATFSLAFGLAGRPAPAALDMVIGARNVVKSESLNTCDNKARDALSTVLGKAAEVPNTGEWEGYGATDASGNSFAAAAIHCYPLDDISGYLVTFTCAAQTPPSTQTASVICDKLAAAFGGQH